MTMALLIRTAKARFFPYHRCKFLPKLRAFSAYAVQAGKTLLAKTSQARFDASNRQRVYAASTHWAE